MSVRPGNGSFVPFTPLRLFFVKNTKEKVMNENTVIARGGSLKELTELLSGGPASSFTAGFPMAISKLYIDPLRKNGNDVEYCEIDTEELTALGDFVDHTLFLSLKHSIMLLSAVAKGNGADNQTADPGPGSDLYKVEEAYAIHDLTEHALELADIFSSLVSILGDRLAASLNGGKKGGAQ